nr:hypothetical protein CFP56_13615 [Quercus suber]
MFFLLQVLATWKLSEIGVEYVGSGGVTSLLSSHNIPDNLSEFGVEYVEIRWHPFQPNPSTPKEGINKKEYYRNKFGSQTKRIEARMSEVFRGHGLEYNLSGLMGNTLDSHRLMHFPGQPGLDKQHNLMEVLSLGYFTQAKFIGDKLIAAHSLSIARYSPPPQSLPFINATTKAYINDTSNECSSNLSSEQGGDSTKFLKVDVESNVQLTPTSILKENKSTYSVTITKERRKKIQKTLLNFLFQFI